MVCHRPFGGWVLESGAWAGHGRDTVRAKTLLIKLLLDRIDLLPQFHGLLTFLGFPVLPVYFAYHLILRPHDVDVRHLPEYQCNEVQPVLQEVVDNSMPREQVMLLLIRAPAVNGIVLGVLGEVFARQSAPNDHVDDTIGEEEDPEDEHLLEAGEFFFLVDHSLVLVVQFFQALLLLQNKIALDPPKEYYYHDQGEDYANHITKYCDIIIQLHAIHAEYIDIRFAQHFNVNFDHNDHDQPRVYYCHKSDYQPEDPEPFLEPLLLRILEVLIKHLGQVQHYYLKQDRVVDYYEQERVELQFQVVEEEVQEDAYIKEDEAHENVELLTSLQEAFQSIAYARAGATGPFVRVVRYVQRIKARPIHYPVLVPNVVVYFLFVINLFSLLYAHINVQGHLIYYWVQQRSYLDQCTD